MRTLPVLRRFAPAVLAGLTLAAPLLTGPAPGPALADPTRPTVAVDPAHATVAVGPTRAAVAVGTATGAQAGTAKCLGAVVQPVAVPSLPPTGVQFCITVGGVLRVESLGPGMLAAMPRKRVECGYAGGVHQCRLTRTGKVTLTVDDGRTIIVRVAEATRPPKPAPACRPKTAVLRLDPAGDGLPWWAECMRVGATVRVQNLGPGALRVTPDRAVSCRYEAAVHTCRLRTAATVTFVTRTPQETRHLTVVAAR